MRQCVALDHSHGVMPSLVPLVAHRYPPLSYAMFFGEKLLLRLWGRHWALSELASGQRPGCTSVDVFIYVFIPARMAEILLMLSKSRGNLRRYLWCAEISQHEW